MRNIRNEVKRLKGEKQTFIDYTGTFIGYLNRSERFKMYLLRIRKLYIQTNFLIISFHS